MKRRHAFTLIELLVVIAIIVALLAILMPSLNKAMLAADRVVDISNARQFSLACLHHAADEFGKLPEGGDYYLWAWFRQSAWDKLEDRYGLERLFGCISTVQEPNPAMLIDNAATYNGQAYTVVPYIYWAGREYTGGGYLSPLKIGDPRATSPTLITCFHRDSSNWSSNTSSSPHADGSGPPIITPPGIKWVEPMYLTTAMIDGSGVAHPIKELRSHNNTSASSAWWYAPRQ